MKLGLVFAIAALGASAASAAEPNSVVGVWKPESTGDRVAIPSLDFTTDGRVFFTSTLQVSQRPDPVPFGQPPLQEIFGHYQTRDDKVVVRVWSGGTTTFQLTKDGRLCVYPGAGVMPATGVIKPQAGQRQCYQRVGVNRS
ncbi:MAG TPA: hypothetical protein VGM25_15605 [Caulobacteraceae bacterium]